MITRELRALRRARLFRQETERTTKSTERVITVCNAGATALSTGFVWQSSISDGVSAADIVVTAIVGGVLFSSLQSLHRYALRLIPQMDTEGRSKVFGVWGGLALAAALVSSTTSMLFLAGPKAFDAHLERSVSVVEQRVLYVTQSMRLAEGLAPMIESANVAADVMAEGEMREGTVCEKGGGRGECHNILTAISKVSAQSSSDILDASARGAPLISLMHSELDRMARTRRNTNQSYQEMEQSVQRSITLIGNAGSQLASLIPVSAIENAAKVYSRDARSMHISQVGAARIREAFSETGRSLSLNLGNLKEAQNFKIEGYRDIQPWDAITQEFKSVWTLCLMALLLDALPLGLCLIMIAVDRQNQRNDADDDHDMSGPPGSPSVVNEPPLQQVAVEDFGRRARLKSS